MSISNSVFICFPELLENFSKIKYLAIWPSKALGAIICDDSRCRDRCIPLSIKDIGSFFKLIYTGAE